MRQILLASVLIALAAMSAPGLFERVKPHLRDDRASQAVERIVESENPQPAGTGASQVEIQAEADGHFYVEAGINFRPVRLMVDTGATVVALRESDAAAAGIRVRPSDFRHPVQTANGTAHAAETELDSVAIGGIEVGGVRALVMPDDQLAISLLGGSFLQRLARYQVADGTLIFEN